MTLTQEATTNELPWSLQELLSLSLACGAGSITVVIAWYGASGETRAAGQMVWLNVAIAGAIVACGAIGVWIAAGRRAIGVRRQTLLDAISRTVPQQTSEAASPSEDFVSGPSMSKFHIRDCPLAAGKAVSAANELRHKRAGRVPCAVCQPLGAKEFTL